MADDIAAGLNQRSKVVLTPRGFGNIHSSFTVSYGSNLAEYVLRAVGRSTIHGCLRIKMFWGNGTWKQGMTIGKSMREFG